MAVRVILSKESVSIFYNAARNTYWLSYSSSFVMNCLRIGGLTKQDSQVMINEGREEQD